MKKLQLFIFYIDGFCRWQLAMFVIWSSNQRFTLRLMSWGKVEFKNQSFYVFNSHSFKNYPIFTNEATLESWGSQLSKMTKNALIGCELAKLSQILWSVCTDFWATQYMRWFRPDTVHTNYHSDSLRWRSLMDIISLCIDVSEYSNRVQWY